MPTEVVKTDKQARMPVKRPKGDVTPYGLIKSAVDQGAGVDTLKELVALQERVSNEEARKAWHAAVARFQADCPELPRVKRGRFGKYAPLGHTLKIVRPHLSDNGLSVTWTTRRYDHHPYPYKVCQLAHELGHVKEAECPIIIDERAGQDRDGRETLNAMQKYGIADTYAERYSFEAVAGLSPAEDDTDGETTVEQPRRKSAPADEPPHPADAETAGVTTVSVEVLEVRRKSGKSSRGPYTKYIAQCSDGNEYGTFKEDLGTILEAAAGQDETITIAWKDGRYGRVAEDIL